MAQNGVKQRDPQERVLYLGENSSLLLRTRIRHPAMGESLWSSLRTQLLPLVSQKKKKRKTTENFYCVCFFSTAFGWKPPCADMAQRGAARPAPFGSVLRDCHTSRESVLRPRSPPQAACRWKPAPDTVAARTRQWRHESAVLGPVAFLLDTTPGPWSGGGAVRSAVRPLRDV